MNIKLPYTTKDEKKHKFKDYINQYQKENKEERKEKRKKYLEKNKEQLKKYREKNKEYINRKINCSICNLEMNNKSLKRHNKRQH